MAGDFWEQAVETYLAMDRALFLNPQYFLGTPGVWEASLDFLAIVIPEHQIYMVEVTKRPGNSLNNKIKGFLSEYKPRIEEQLNTLKVAGKQKWTIGLWLFVPDEKRVATEKKARDLGISELRVTSLEETIKPSAWDHRFR